MSICYPLIVQETLKRKVVGFLCLFFLPGNLSAVVDVFIYLELFQDLMCGVTFSCFDASGKM